MNEWYVDADTKYCQQEESCDEGSQDEWSAYLYQHQNGGSVSRTKLDVSSNLETVLNQMTLITGHL